jgi:hypothetical protein
MAGMHNMLMATERFAFRHTKVISTDTLNYNLKADALANGWNGVDPLISTVTVNTGIYVGSSTNTGYGFDTGLTFPEGSYLRIVNNGFIVGAGGKTYSRIGGSPTDINGGPALRAQHAVTVTNAGTIGGGGGRGGDGGTGTPAEGGFGGGTGGIGGGGRGYSPGEPNGSKSAPGPGEAGTIGGGTGGYGGNLGEAGQAGSAGSHGSGEAGGADGAAVAGNSYITWEAEGTRLGAIT